VIQKLHTDFTPEYYQERSFLRVSVTTNLKLVELLFTRKWFVVANGPSSVISVL